jgi:hypothetical protein
MEQVREGMFLRTTGRKDTKTDARKLSILVDAYTNLGFYTGTEISLPKLWLINNFTLSAGLAFTRTIFKSGSAYIPYDMENLEQHWDKSHIFGMEVPFRYRFKTSPSLSGKYGSISLSLPIYSDPFIDYDVMNRSESIDWMEMLRQGAATQAPPDSSPTSMGAFEWNLTARPQFSTAAFDPYVSNLSINSISSVYHFSVYTNRKPEIPGESPEKQFYAPDKFTMYSISAAVSGTPLTWVSATSVAEKDKEIPDVVKPFGVLKSPWGEDTLNTASRGASSIQKPFSLDVPALNQVFDIGRNSGLKISWNYSLTPTSASELYYSTSWTSPGDIDLSDIKSILMRVRTDGSTGISISEPNNNLFSISGGISGFQQWQGHTYINEEMQEYDTDEEVARERESDYRSTLWTTSWTHNTTVNPFYWSPAWKTTNVQYTLGGLLARSNFNGTGDDPKWETIYGEWTKEKITAHNMAANIGVSILDYMQSLQLQTELPPRDSSMSLNSTINAWITRTAVSTKINKPFEPSPEYQPVTFTETLTFKPGYTFNQNLVYDPLISDWRNLASTLTLSKFTARYTASYSPGFVLGYDEKSGTINGWKARPNSEQKLRPLSLEFGFSTSVKKDNLLNKTLSFSIDPGIRLSLNLQQYTYSLLDFTLNFTLNISKFLSLTMGTKSVNNEMYRYLTFLPFFDEFSSEIERVLPKKNFFEDLINSFRFDNDELRRDSGFKLQSFTFSATHHLGDWDAKLTVSMAPWRPDNSRVYEFDTQISFLVQWLPISELKTEIAYNGKEPDNKFLTK